MLAEAPDQLLEMVRCFEGNKYLRPALHPRYSTILSDLGRGVAFSLNVYLNALPGITELLNSVATRLAILETRARRTRDDPSAQFTTAQVRAVGVWLAAELRILRDNTQRDTWGALAKADVKALLQTRPRRHSGVWGNLVAAFEDPILVPSRKAMEMFRTWLWQRSRTEELEEAVAREYSSSIAHVLQQAALEHESAITRFRARRDAWRQLRSWAEELAVTVAVLRAMSRSRAIESDDDPFVSSGYVDRLTEVRTVEKYAGPDLQRQQTTGSSHPPARGVQRPLTEPTPRPARSPSVRPRSEIVAAICVMMQQFDPWFVSEPEAFEEDWLVAQRRLTVIGASATAAGVDPLRAPLQLLHDLLADAAQPQSDRALLAQWMGAVHRNPLRLADQLLVLRDVVRGTIERSALYRLVAQDRAIHARYHDQVTGVQMIALLRRLHGGGVRDRERAKGELAFVLAAVAQGHCVSSSPYGKYTYILDRSDYYRLVVAPIVDGELPEDITFTLAEGVRHLDYQVRQDGSPVRKHLQLILLPPTAGALQSGEGGSSLDTSWLHAPIPDDVSFAVIDCNTLVARTR